MKKNFIPITLITAIMFGISACSSKAADQENENTSTSHALPVDVKIVSPASLNQTEVLAGSLVPNREVTIMGEVTKKIVAVSFKDGSYVSKGQLLYQLDAADIRAKISQLNAELRLARLDEKRFYELLKTETVRQEEYDRALAKRQVLEASAQYLQAELSKTYIKAPFSGVIGISKVQTGAIVSPGTPLVTLQEQGMIKIMFTVSEKYLPLIKIGTKIRFTTELNESLNATITATEPGVDQQSRNITVQAKAANPSGKLKPGMSAKVYFNTGAPSAHYIPIPTEALIPGNNGYQVFILKNGKAKMTPVTISNRNEEKAIITSGLRNGDTLMISNILRAMDGTPVQIVNYQ